MRGILIPMILQAGFILFAPALRAQEGLTASFTPAAIRLQESAELRFVIEQSGRIDRFTPPVLNQFHIISGPGTESGMEVVNGRSRRYTVVYYRLQPRRAGVITVGPALVQMGGRLFKSRPLTLRVSSPVAQSPASSASAAPEDADAGYNDYVLQPGENVQQKTARNLFVTVETDKTSCYVGEPLVATYKLYTRLKSESNIIRSPSFNGFSVVELQLPQSGNRYTVEQYRGRAFNVYTLRKVQLYPLQSGTAELEPVAVENRLQFIRGEYLRQPAADLLGTWIPGALPAGALLEEQVTVETKPITVTVKPLPENGRPASFTGAVGQFSLSALVLKDSLTTDETGTLKLLLTGAGNMQLIPPPEIRWPAGTEGYDPTVKEGYNRLSVPVSGSRIFDYPFNVNVPGRTVLPPVEFSYFDPARGSYQSLSTPALPLQVLPGRTAGPAAKATTHRGLPAWLWWLIPAMAAAALALYRWQRRRTVTEPAVIPEPPPLSRAALPLQGAEALLLHDNARLFYETLHRELYHFLGNRLGLMPEAVSKKTVAEALQRNGADPALRRELELLLDELALKVYSRAADTGSMQDDFVRAERLVRQLGTDPANR